MQGFEILLQRLAGRDAHSDDGPTSDRLRQEVEARLTPLIRCAIERDVGAPALLRWVKQTLPQLGFAERNAPVMARRLCSSLIRQIDQRAVRSYDTVLERAPVAGRFTGAGCDTVLA
jgi:hypothetical protein